MTKQSNPFQYGRIEQEDSPCIYIPDQALEWLTSMSYRFEGPRGSGKSSVLNAFRWELVWHDPPLMNVTCSDDLRNKLFCEPHHLGVYYRFEEMDTPYWNRWSQIVGEKIAQKYFGTYIEYTLVYSIFNALHSIQNFTGELLTRGEAERELVQQVLNELFPKQSERPKLIDSSFATIRDIILHLQLGLRDLDFLSYVK